ncbi:MAG TPA: 6-carboxytetrahydropterin synthase [Pseudohaliea sp.]|nr:6-carboxytetrahydropterin synthase [Pseudohaliea sp.]
MSDRERLTTLYIDKESHKFSAAHYTIFAAGDRERLHGHNYAVSAKIVAPMGNNGFAADYNVYKDRIKALCDELDEYLILPAHSPYQTVEEAGDEYRVRFGTEEMRFLRSDTLLLPIVNATVEELSSYLLERLQQASRSDDLRELRVCVASGPGQRGCASWRAP